MKPFGKSLLSNVLTVVVLSLLGATSFADGSTCQNLFRQANQSNQLVAKETSDQQLLADLQSLKNADKLPMARVISRSGLNREEAISLANKLVDLGLVAGRYHELAYLALTKASPRFNFSSRRDDWRKTTSDFRGIFYKKSSLKNLAAKYSNPANSQESVILGKKMSELIIDVIEQGRSNESTFVRGKHFNRYGDEHAAEGINYLYTTKKDSKAFQEAYELLKDPRARKFFEEMYVLSVPNIARSTYWNSGGIISRSLAKLTTIGANTAAVVGGLGGLVGFFPLIMDGHSNLAMSGAAVTAVTMGLASHIPVATAKLPAKLFNLPQKLVGDYRARKFQKLLTDVSSSEISAETFRFLTEPYETKQAQLIYQKSKLPEISEDTGFMLARLDGNRLINKVQEVADARAFITSVTVRTLDDTNFYAQKLRENIEEFAVAHLAPDSTVLNDQQRINVIQTIRSNTHELKRDRSAFERELREQQEGVKSLIKELSSEKASNETAGAIANLKMIESTIRQEIVEAEQAAADFDLNLRFVEQTVYDALFAKQLAGQNKDVSL